MPAKLAVIAGQSNAVGATYGSATITGFDYPTTFPYACDISSVANPPVWANHAWGNLGTRQSSDGAWMHGPEIDMGRRLEEVEPGYWCILKFAMSSSSMEHWNPDGTYPTMDPPNLFTQFLERIALAETEQSTTLKYVAWLQGEADASTTGNANAYATNMIEFRDALWVQYPGVPIILARLNDSSALTYASTVREKQDYLGTQPGFYVVNMDSYTMMADGIHYPVASHQAFGREFVNTYLTSLLGRPHPRSNIPGTYFSSYIG